MSERRASLTEVVREIDDCAESGALADDTGACVTFTIALKSEMQTTVLSSMAPTDAHRLQMSLKKSMTWRKQAHWLTTSVISGAFCNKRRHGRR